MCLLIPSGRGCIDDLTESTPNPTLVTHSTTKNCRRHVNESTTSIPTPSTLHTDASLLDLILSKLNSSTPTGKKPVRTKASRGVLEDDSSRQLRDLLSRSIKMAVHQGYQSLPPGSQEILQAGGGGSPETQEGGGLRLQGLGVVKQPEGVEGVNNRHHHNHY